ncbi:MAG TPA: sigma-70 family RNA polymerase sigma factor [Balneolaceae bacterium]|nr:sigma-70 family RNA polymerase sigma factor [Balneolaceae bacterium]
MEITKLLVKASSGDKEAYNSLYPLVYEKLRLLAQKQLNKEYSDHTLCKTELVHEAYEKMIDQSTVDYNDRAHFFAIAARSMRQILVDYARKKKALKRGGEFSKVDIDINNLQAHEHAEQILVLNDALDELKRLDERICTVVELRFFGGLSIEETSDVLNISPSTINRDWLKARGWLHQKLKG